MLESAFNCIAGSLFRRLKAVTLADGRDLQMQRSMPWMTAVFEKIFFGFLGAANLHQGWIRMPFPKMRAKTTLTVLHM
jgi:hypothetical protein